MANRELHIINRISGLGAALLSLTIVLGAFLVIFSLLQSARAGVEAQLSLTRLEEFSVHLNAEEWHATADPEFFSESRSRIANYRSSIEQLFAEFDRSYPGDESLAAIRETYRDYVQYLDREFELMQAGRYDEARNYDQIFVDAAYLELELMIGETAGRFAEQSERQETLAYVGSIITAMSGAVLIGFLFWRYDRTRQDKVRVETEKQLFHDMSLVDDLTQLYNRRGFLTLAGQQLKTAAREKKSAVLLFCDLDDMKWINDHLGHLAGDQALRDISMVLKETFRESDIIARLGGDEFVVFAMETPGSDHDSPVLRLQKSLVEFNSRQNMLPVPPPRLSLSIGVARFDSAAPSGIEELISQADKLMYEHKKRRASGDQAAG